MNAQTLVLQGSQPLIIRDDTQQRVSVTIGQGNDLNLIEQALRVRNDGGAIDWVDIQGDPSNNVDLTDYIQNLSGVNWVDVAGDPSTNTGLMGLLANYAALGNANLFTAPNSRFKNGLTIGRGVGEGIADNYITLTNTNYYNSIYFQSGNGSDASVSTYGQMISSPAIGLFFDFNVGVTYRSQNGSTIFGAFGNGYAQFNGSMELGHGTTEPLNISNAGAYWQIGQTNSALLFYQGAGTGGQNWAYRFQLGAYNGGSKVILSTRHEDAAATGDHFQALNAAGTILTRISAAGDLYVPNVAYGVGWNGNTRVPTCDAVYDQIETVKATVAAKADSSALASYVLASEKGAANGFAPLDGSGQIPLAYLANALDEVGEYTDLASFPATGKAGKLYVALDTKFTYVWSGSTYAQTLSASSGGGPANTDGLAEGSLNLYFTNARAIAATLTGLDTTTTGAVSAADTVKSAIGKLYANQGLKFDKAGGVVTGTLTMDASLVMRADPNIIIKSADGATEYGRFFAAAAGATIRGAKSFFADVAGTVYGTMDSTGLALTGSTLTLNGQAVAKLGTVQAWSATQQFSTGGNIAANTANTVLQAVSDGTTGNGAFIGFNRTNQVAIYAGLDSDNKFKIGGWSWGTTPKLTLDNAGNLSVTGTLYAAGVSSSGNLTYTSDRRAKTSIRPYEVGDLFERIEARRYVKDDREQIGFITQELIEAGLPEAVHIPEDPEEFQSLELGPVVAALVAEVKALRARVADLEAV